MGEVIQIFALLMAAHFVADYPLQGELLAKAKAEGPLRVWHLFGHSVIHGAGVYLVTGSMWLFAAEIILHTTIDEAKTRGWTTFAEDQFAHVVCKLAWTSLIVGAWS